MLLNRGTPTLTSIRTPRLLVITAVCLSLSLPNLPQHKVVAQEPPSLSRAQIARLTRDGDRLADQGDYLNALTKYTEAYMGVVTRIRGQKFLRSVTPNMYTREKLGEEMLRMMDEEYTDEELALMDSSYKVLGLVPPSLDCQELMTQLLTDEVAGFYDPDEKRMVLIVEEGSKGDPGWFAKLLGARPAFDKDEQKTTLAHELTHALQDQLYDLNAMQEGIEKDDDMLLAFSALVEGDATLLMFAEADGGNQDITQMDPEAMRATFSIMSWVMPLAGGDTYRKAPAIFRESLIFPYIQGMLFTLSIAGNEGWDAVHRAYQNPPLSTEQILHPDKYTRADTLDVPQSVSIPDLATVVGQEWHHLGGNCLGELQTKILLTRVAGGSAAAEGWDGDRYEVYRNSDGKLAVVLASIWDSKEDAKQFATAYRKYRSQSQAGEAEIFADDFARKILRKGDQVWVVEGFSNDITESIVTALSECEFTEKTFPFPRQTAADAQ